MANYTFDTMSQSDANAFTSADYLFFLSGGVDTLGVVNTSSTTTITALGTTTTAETITLTENGKTLVFDAAKLSAASTSSPNHIVFSHDVAVFGTDGDNNGIGSNPPALDASAGTAGNKAVVYGFSGNDVLIGGAASDTLNAGDGNDTITGSSSGTENDFLLGGAGNDVIDGGAGNDHIYGNVAVGAAGTADGFDIINAGAGHDYVNGNAGDDFINGQAGNDRLYGGAGIDDVEGGDGNDYIQGNLGNDTLHDTGAAATDNDTIHGGQGNDTITDSAGSNQLYGDLGDDPVTGGTGNDWIGGGDGNDVLSGGGGNDVLVGGAGYDNLSGNGGADTFTFATGDAGVAKITATAATTDVVTDFVSGTDHFSLGFAVAAVDTAGTTFASVNDAYTYAKGILAGHGSDVASLDVTGVGTVLFWDSSHSTGTIDSALELTNAAAVVKADFI